jgi:hypothetical protein
MVGWASEEWANRWVEGWVVVAMGGWVGFRVGFININYMYNNDVGKRVHGFMKLMK